MHINMEKGVMGTEADQNACLPKDFSGRGPRLQVENLCQHYRVWGWRSNIRIGCLFYTQHIESLVPSIPI